MNLKIDDPGTAVFRNSSGVPGVNIYPLEFNSLYEVKVCKYYITSDFLVYFVEKIF
jgi:hypothetical protein